MKFTLNILNVIIVVLFISSLIDLSLQNPPAHVIRVMQDCGCPRNCLSYLRVCLIAGACRRCKTPNYGKRRFYPTNRQNSTTNASRPATQGHFLFNTTPLYPKES